jgi:hypothetical protein
LTINKLSFLVVVSVFLFLSCANFPFSRSNSSKSAQPKKSPTQESVTQNDSPELPVQELPKDRHLICGNQNGQLIIYGVSGRLSKPNDEIEAAKQDAARKAAMYHGIQGSVVSVNRTAANILEYTSDSAISLNYDTNVDRYLERLTFDPEKDVMRTSGTFGSPGAVIVRMKYNAPDLINANYKSVITSGFPSWINNRDLPEVPGYITAIGLSGKKSELRDTITSSMQAAAARLIENASTQMSISDKTGASVVSSTVMQSRSEGKLSNFQALEFWVADNGAVYTLAIARVSQ